MHRGARLGGVALVDEAQVLHEHGESFTLLGRAAVVLAVLRLEGLPHVLLVGGGRLEEVGAGAAGHGEGEDDLLLHLWGRF